MLKTRSFQKRGKPVCIHFDIKRCKYVIGGLIINHLSMTKTLKGYFQRRVFMPYWVQESEQVGRRPFKAPIAATIWSLRTPLTSLLLSLYPFSVPALSWNSGM